MDTTYCQKCGSENSSEANFCRNCGSPLTNNEIGNSSNFDSSQFPKYIAYTVTLRKTLNTYIGTLYITPDEIFFAEGCESLNWHNFKHYYGQKYSIADIAEIKNGILALMSIRFKDGSVLKLAPKISEKKEIIAEIESRRKSLQ